MKKAQYRKSSISRIGANNRYVVHDDLFRLAVIQADHRYLVTVAYQQTGENALLHFGAADHLNAGFTGQYGPCVRGDKANVWPPSWTWRVGRLRIVWRMIFRYTLRNTWARR